MKLPNEKGAEVCPTFVHDAQGSKYLEQLSIMFIGSMFAQQKHPLRAMLITQACNLLYCDVIITCHVHTVKYMHNIVALRIATMHLSQMGLLGYHG